MDRVTLYLRNSLFTLGGDDGHIPSAVMILEGNLQAKANGTVTIKVSIMRDMRGKPLSETATTLQLPWSKIDHMLIHED